MARTGTAALAKSGHRFSDKAMLEQNMVRDALTVFC